MDMRRDIGVIAERLLADEAFMRRLTLEVATVLGAHMVEVVARARQHDHSAATNEGGD